MCVCSLRYLAWNAIAPFYNPLACPHYNISPTLSHKRYDWRKKLLSIWGSADKSLARPTSRYSRKESTVSLERGACSCAEFKVFSCYRGWKEAHQATRLISKTWRRELSSGFFFLQVKAPNKIHAILAETLGENAPLYATVKNWWTNLIVVIFPPMMRLVLDVPKEWPPRRLFIKFTSLSWKIARIRLYRVFHDFRT